MSVEKVPVRSAREPQACAKGNHDNPVSGILNIEHLPILTQREGRDGSKAISCDCTRRAQHEQNG